MLAEIEGTWSASLPVPNWAVSAPAFSSQQSLPQADGDTAVQVWVGARSPPGCTDPNEDGNGSVRRGLQNGTGGGGGVPEPSHIPVPRVPGTEFILPGALGPLQLHRDPKWGEGWDPAYPHRGGAGCRGGQTRGTGRRAMPSGVMQGHGSAQRGEPGGGGAVARRSPGSVRAPLAAGMAAPCLRRVKEAEEAGSGPSLSP